MGGEDHGERRVIQRREAWVPAAANNNNTVFFASSSSFFDAHQRAPPPSRLSLSLSLSLFSLSGIGCLRPYTRFCGERSTPTNKTRKVWRDQRRPFLVLTSSRVVVVVVAFPIDAQKWTTASCFRVVRVPFRL